MATTSEHIDNNVNKEEEAKKLQTSSNDGEQDNKTTEKIDDLNQIKQSTNEDKKSDQISPTSDTNIEKNEETKVETTSTTTITTTEKKEESESTPVSSTLNNNEDSKKATKKEELTTITSDQKKDNDNTFHIEKGDAQHLTDFQRQKAKYFFNVNLDIENKEYVTWEDVEFYLLFHETASGKEGSDSGDLEGRLSRAARAFWEHIHDQIPLPDGKRDTLTLDQFLDTWASLIDYVVETNQLPPIVHDLVKLGFELYSTDNGDGKSPTIQPQAFDQLFQKMNLGRPYAIMAYKYLTENGTKPLDADKIDSIVKAVITSSDDEHDSHFLLPGFFKIISDNKNNEKDNKNKSPSSPVQRKEQPEKPSPASPPPSPSTPPSEPQLSTKPSSPPSQPQQSNLSSSPSPQVQQKPTKPPPSSSKSQQQNGLSSPPPAQEKKPDKPAKSQKQPTSTSQNGVFKPPTSAPSTNQQQNIHPPPPPQIAAIQQENENIRRLLRYYHIDDGDIVEVADGSVPRLVLVHPERPLPPYIQQNKQLLQKLQSGSPNVLSIQQNGLSNHENSLQEATEHSAETKPKITLEERISRGEAQKGPTIPSRPEQKRDDSFSTGARQVYPQLSEVQQEEQRKQAKLQATQPNNNDEKQTKEETSIINDASLSSSKQDDTKTTNDISRDDEDKIIAAVLKQLAPIVEKRVAAELHRIQSGDTDEDEDENFIPFPFMLGGGFPFFAAPHGGPPPQAFKEQQQTSSQNPSDQGSQQQVNEPGMQGGAAFIPPQLLMAMMNDLARGGMGGQMPGFPTNMPPPPQGPIGVEGFMMFVDDDQLIGVPPGYPPRPGPGF